MRGESYFETSVSSQQMPQSHIVEDQSPQAQRFSDSDINVAACLTHMIHTVRSQCFDYSRHSVHDSNKKTRDIKKCCLYVIHF